MVLAMAIQGCGMTGTYEADKKDAALEIENVETEDDEEVSEEETTETEGLSDNLKHQRMCQRMRKIQMM